MTRLLVAMEPGAGIAPEALADAWNADNEASAAGTARVEAAGGRDFFSGLELVVIPLAVNLASSASYDLLKGLVARLRHGQEDAPPLEVAEAPAGGGDVVIVVRAGASR
jgi:predicted RNA-binding Zn ribbon-like protein